MKIRALAFCLLSLLTLPAFAQTTVASWSMGDDDTGAANGNAVNATLTASVGSNLDVVGSGLTYTSNTAPGSTGDFAVSFTGLGYYNVASNLGLTTNFAMETWVNFPSVNSSPQWVIRVGNGGSNGAGVLLSDSKLKAINSGDLIYGIANDAAPNTWYHVALVVDQAGQAQMYLNGGLVTGATFNANSFASNFGFGADENGNAPLQGILDDAKVFTFATGTFTTAMLNGGTPVPEPSTWAAFAGLTALSFVFFRRRRSSSNKL